MLISVALEEDDDDDWNPWGLEFEQEGKGQEMRQAIDWQKDFGMNDVHQQDDIDGVQIVEVWGKAAIGNKIKEIVNQS